MKNSIDLPVGASNTHGIRFPIWIFVHYKTNYNERQVNNMKKYIVTREAAIYIVVNAENEAEAIEKAFEEHGLDEYEIDAADDDAKVEEYVY